ncbi:MAG: hypothetical protein WDN26_08120 [Chitinophagaceae bacterium]
MNYKLLLSLLYDAMANDTWFVITLLLMGFFSGIEMAYYSG